VILKKSDDATTIDGAGLIQQQILSRKAYCYRRAFEVITYKNQEKYLMGIITFDKKH
jgi:hypothetical protein